MWRRAPNRLNWAAKGQPREQPFATPGKVGLDGNEPMVAAEGTLAKTVVGDTNRSAVGVIVGTLDLLQDDGLGKSRANSRALRREIRACHSA